MTIIPQTPFTVCAWEGCTAAAVAFLQRVRTEADGSKETVSQFGYCQVHAVEMHNQLSGIGDYEQESFSKPNPL